MIILDMKRYGNHCALKGTDAYGIIIKTIILFILEMLKIWSLGSDLNEIDPLRNQV